MCIYGSCVNAAVSLVVNSLVLPVRSVASDITFGYHVILLEFH